MLTPDEVVKFWAEGDTTVWTDGDGNYSASMASFAAQLLACREALRLAAKFDITRPSIELAQEARLAARACLPEFQDDV